MTDNALDDIGDAVQGLTQATDIITDDVFRRIFDQLVECIQVGIESKPYLVEYLAYERDARHRFHLVQKRAWPDAKPWDQIVPDAANAESQPLDGQVDYCAVKRRHLWIVARAAQPLKECTPDELQDCLNTEMPLPGLPRYVDVRLDSDQEARTSILIPLFRDGHVTGVLNVEFSTRMLPNAKTRRFFDRCATELAHAQDLNRSFKRQARGKELALSLLQERVRSIGSNRNSIGAVGACDVLIVVAMKEEITALLTRHHFEQGSSCGVDCMLTTLLRDDQQPVRVATVIQREMGGVEAAALATRAAMAWKPKSLVMIGIMGGFKHQKVSLGDVIIARDSVDYAFGKIGPSKDSSNGEDEVKQDPRWCAAPEALIDRVNQWVAMDEDPTNEMSLCLHSFKSTFFGRAIMDLSSGFGSRVHVGPVASGPLVVASEKKIKEIMALNRHLLGVEMEINGMMRAARRLPIERFIAIKGVSDFANATKDLRSNVDSQHARRYAAHSSTEIAIRLIQAGIL